MADHSVPAPAYWKCPTPKCSLIKRELPTCPDCSAIRPPMQADTEIESQDPSLVSDARLKCSSTTQPPSVHDRDTEANGSGAEKSEDEEEQLDHPEGHDGAARQEDVHRPPPSHEQHPPDSAVLTSQTGAGCIEQRPHDQAVIQQRIEPKNELIQHRCPNTECEYILEKVTKFCPECGIRITMIMSPTGHRPSEPSQVVVQEEKPNQPPEEKRPEECYFCKTPLNITASGNKQCTECRRLQPLPEGPPCVHGCGARLIKQNAKACGRCGRSQFNRTPTKPPATAEDTSHSNPGYSSGYGYPNNPSPQEAQVYTLPGLPHSSTQQTPQFVGSGESQSGSLVTSPSTPISTCSSNLPHGGRSTDSPTSSDLHTSHDHPSTALKRKRTRQDDVETDLQTPVQETSPYSSSAAPQHLDNPDHPLKTGDNNKGVITVQREGNTSQAVSPSESSAKTNKKNTNSDIATQITSTVGVTYIATTTTTTVASTGTSLSTSTSTTTATTTTATTSASASSMNENPNSKQPPVESEGFVYKKPSEPEHLLQPQSKNKKKPKIEQPQNVIVIDGLNAPSKRSMELTFHVLIPKSFWEWDSTSSVHIRFGHPKLGNWKSDCGNFQETRYCGDGVSMMTCIFHNFDVEILKYPLPYKYIVHSPKSEKDHNCYEYLHGHTKEFDRCLNIPHENQKSPGIYHQYDTIAYPQNTKLSLTKSSWKNVLLTTFTLGYYGNSKDKDKDGQNVAPENFIPLVSQAKKVYCLDQYLLKYKEMLCSGNIPEGVDIHLIASDISFICKSILVEKICPINVPLSNLRVYQSNVSPTDFQNNLKSWFESVIMSLANNTELSPSKRLISATCVLHCIKMPSVSLLYVDNPETFLLPLAGMLTLQPDGDVRAEYEFLCTYIPPEQKIFVADAISKLCLRLAQKAIKSFAIEWLLVLPLYHLLSGQSALGDEMKMDLKIDAAIYNAKLGIMDMQGKAQMKKNFVVTYYDQIKDYFSIDPMILKLFAFLAPKEDFAALCKRVPPFLSTEILTQRALLKVDPEDKSWSNDIENLKCAYADHSAHYSSDAYMSAMVQSSLCLCSKLSKKLESSNEKSVKLLRGAFSCVLCAIENAHTVYEGEIGEIDRKRALNALGKTLSGWITCENVIGGSIFGHSVRSYWLRSDTSWKGRQELKVWQSLLSVNIPAEYQSLKNWHNLIRKIIYDRIHAVTSEKLKIDLVIEMEKVENIHPVLEGIIMDAALKAVDVLLSNPERYRNQINIESLAKEESQRVGKLLGRVFDRQYPNLAVEPTLDELFGWNNWPRYISICEYRPKLKQGLSPNCVEACSCAQATVLSLCNRCHTGQVSINELKIVVQNVDQILSLFQACTGIDENKNLVHMTKLKSTVNERKKEFSIFFQRQTVLKYLCRFINDEVKGLTELRQELDRDCGEVNLCDLCTRDPDSHNVILLCFKTAGTLCDFVDSFYTMSRRHGSDFFAAAWQKSMTSALKNSPDLDLSGVYPLVWEPCLEDIKQLLKILSNLSIKLVDIDRDFLHHKDQIDTQLLALFKGVNECTDENFNWSLIERAINRIRQYWELCRYREGANIFLEIRDSLGLEHGDFSTVQKLSQELTTGEGSQTLSDVDESLILAGHFLEDIANDSQKVECLDRFSKCKDIVKWLKDETKDVNEIQHFVNVALATSAGGEGDLSHDKLSHLRTVGSGFASLIYNFPENAGFVELKEACTYVWDALSKNPNLPGLLEGCNKDIDWYHSVKETQGSVEVTSYGQMRNILKYGTFQVGTVVQSKPVHGIHDLISLKLRVRDKQLSKTTYNLDELRDLESKLVLITGSKAENRTEVDHYLNVLQHVTRIAEVLLALRQAGNVAYSERVVMITCAVYTQGDIKEPQLDEELAAQNVAELNASAKEMENALEQWENEVKESRNRYYELNYYTTLQLLKLRKELGLVRLNTGRSVDQEVLSLLHSISHEINTETVCSVLAELKKDRVDLQAAAELVHDNSGEIDLELEACEVQLPPMISEDNSISREFSVPQTSVASPKSETLGPTDNINPHLTEQDLNSDQKEILTDLVEYQGYPRLLVLKALEECLESANAYDIQEWCANNEHLRFEDDEEVVSLSGDSSTSSSSSSSSEDEEEESIFIHSPQQVSNRDKVQRKVSPAAAIPKVKVVHRPIINESHPMVQQLVEEFEYDLELSIDAVRLSGGNLERAMDLLAKRETENEDEVLPESELAIDVEFVEGKTEDGDNIIVYDDIEAEEKFLSVDELGAVLRSLSEHLPEPVSKQRAFMEELKAGSLNLIVTHPVDVLRTVLTLYMEDEDLPLPSLEEVLLCNSTTTAEDVILLWQRAIYDPGFKRIFCLVHAEKLSYQICDKVVEALKDLTQGRQDYRLVIVCSKEGEDKSHIVSKLLLHKKSIVLRHNDEKFQKYLSVHFCDSRTVSQAIPLRASVVDHEDSCVRVVSSNHAGMGKSLFIRRMAEKLGAMSNTTAEAVKVVVPIHGPTVTSDVIMVFLKEHYKDEKCKIYQFDIAPSVLYKVDTILFSLLILRGMSDSHGRMWRCHPAQLYAIEVSVPDSKDTETKLLPEARTMDFLNLLPTVHCISPMEAVKTINPSPFQVGMDSKEFQNPTFQRVYQYLRRHTGKINLDRFKYQGKTEGSTSDCLRTFLESCGVQNPSWSEIHHFVTFLDLQLKSCEESVFCDEALVGDVMSGLKGFVVTFMITMSRDFATPSLRGEIARDSLDQPHEGEILEQYDIEQRRRWEESSHPYIFFNNDGISITFVGFIINKNGDLIDPRRTVLQPRIMTPHLYTGLRHQGVNFSDDYRNWKKDTMIEKLSLVMGVDYPHDPDETYVLTVDNLIKILAIQMRFRCGIPVVIMGETGCGKTRLIRYMCDLAREGREGKNMLIMKIHGGIKENDIIDFMNAAEKQAKANTPHNMDTVVFFDEANTTDAIGLIKEIMCDRRIHGRPVSSHLKFIAACNPYRRHSDKMIERLETAGLGFYVRATETQQKLGKIPLRQLVYRVLELPPSMRPLVYDFGQLKKDTEDDYIRQIVHDHVKNSHPNQLTTIVPAITGVLAVSQSYMREREDECSFVSLRDVERAMIVFEYFCEKIEYFRKADQKLAVPSQEDDELEEEQHPTNITSALVLAVSVCYHARLQDRQEYEQLVASEFVAPLDLPGGAAQFRNEITWCQNVLLDNMELGQNIAKNAALRENVFMMAICIELRIPLFLVGKPGSSKSLAKSIIQDSMHGKTSRSDLLKTFKQVHMFSYQCSQLATPESVIEVFKSAKRFQSTQDTTQYVSVVVLDEVGLAEDSPNLPLKALHPLLEDGTEGAGVEGRDEVIERDLRVAFIGISNWALDPAKMNRGVMVTRGTPDIRELRFSAKGICGEEANDNAKTKLEPYFEHLAEAYEMICRKQKREFFGLRDFYSLIKMLYWMCKKSKGLPLTWPQMKHAIMRNFGGLKSDEWDPFEVFKEKLNLPEEDINPEEFDEEIRPLVNPDCSRLGLIKTSLDTRETSFHGENRYLLFLTENYAALDILEHYIRGKKHQSFEPVETTELGDATQTTLSLKPFTLFGSSFPKDKEYTQVCRNINQIKICMETGRTVILLNLENLYESLYDVLNQYYMHYGDNRYVDLGLQTHRVKCRVHKNFKLILIAERETVYEKFPTPLINRLEKHFVLTSSVLKDWQQDVLYAFQDWISEFSGVRGATGGGKFVESHAFIGYQKDTPAAVVFQASRQLKRLRKGQQWRISSLHENRILGDVNPEELMCENKGSNVWKIAVLRLSQYLLLQIASDDALIRLKNTTLADKQNEYMQLYFGEQHHDSIIDFIHYHIQNDDETQGGLLMQVTTHGHLLLREELEKVEESVHMKVEAFLLQEFDTELDFSNKVGPLFQREIDDDYSRLIIIQCDSGHINGDLIACARYRIYDERVKAKEKNMIQGRDGVTHVLFIINLPHQVSTSTFIGFQGDPWLSAHIDDIRPTSVGTIEPLHALQATISELFIGDYIDNFQALLDKQYVHLKTQVSQTISEEASQDEHSHEDSQRSSQLSKQPYSDHKRDEREIDVENEGTQQSPIPLDSDEESDDYDEEKTENVVSSESSLVLQSDGIPDQSTESQEESSDSEENNIGESGKETVFDIDEKEDIDEKVYIKVSTVTAVKPDDNAFESVIAEDHPVKLETTANVSTSIEPLEIPKPKRKPQIDIDQYPVGQCRRLYGCIQAAASKLEDATKDRSTQRVTRLTKLIPRVPAHYIDPDSFCGILVMHLYSLLKEREADRPDLSEWVLSEALNAGKLEVGGTFRNVLARKIDEVVIPIFAKIIACIDCNYNLDLIDPKAQDSPLSQLWLAIFREPKILQLKYSELVQGDRLPGVGSRKSNRDFKGKMPFSWLIRDAVDTQWDITKSRAEADRISQHNQFCECILTTRIGAVLETVDTENCDMLYESYRYDFVRSVHKCKFRDNEHVNMEYQLISDALDHLVNSSDFDHHQSLISRIAALHLVFENNKSQILWFSQLVSHFPSVMKSLQGMLPDVDFPEMELHLHAAMKVMVKLEPPLKKDNPNPNLTEWLNYMRRSQNAITSILSLKSFSEVAQQARYCWQRLRGTQLFVEHVVLKHPDVDLKLPARRLAGLWKGNADFLKVQSVKSVQLQLNSMEKGLKKDGVDKQKIKEVKKSCREFFMEIVSNLCFGGRAAPEPDLIKMLLDNVFVEENKSTQEVTPYKGDKADKIPTIRSFLLQLLLEHSVDQVRDHLKDYLDRSCHIVSGKQANIDQDLHLLIIQCFEDSLAKRFSSQCLLAKAHEATSILKDYSALHNNQGTPTLEFLEGVAKVRYSLIVVAEVLKGEKNGQKFKDLLEAARTICSDRKVNCIDPNGRRDTVGPVIYLLKLLVRQYGMPCLNAAAEVHEWIIPAELRSTEDKSVDPFIVYGDNYKPLRDLITGAIYGNQLEQLEQHAQNLQPQEVVYLLLALYEKATLSRTSTNPSKRIGGEAVEKLNDFIINYKLFSNDLRFTARALLANQQGGRILEQMSVSPQQPVECRTLLEVVVHTATVFFGRQKVDVLRPFINILSNPAALNHAYLPTMPEDQLVNTQVAMTAADPTGKYYECPRGHRYFVGNCGGVVAQGLCNVCRAPIGGTNYNLQQGNKLANLQDTTKVGHDLGAVQNRTHISPERDLSARAVCILRALMHSAFIWAICNNEANTGAIAGLVTPPVPPQQLPEFFWAHLVKDLELLGKDTGRGLEENVMIVHLVLRHILTTKPPIDGTVQTVSTLATKDARKNWEKIFNQYYIQPVLTNLDQNLAQSMDMVANDDQQDLNQLFYLVYEKVKCREKSLEPHLWTYRSRITLEHLRQSLHDKKKKENYPILSEFLHTETELRATQYLPDIAKLQQCLFDKFNRQIDKKDSKKQTVGMFIRELPNETVKNEYHEMITSFKAAWALVGHKLKKHSRIPVEEKYYIGQIDDNTPMEYLVPTTSEAGVCTTALVDFLTLTHNNFIERCRAKTDQSSISLSFWREHKIPIFHIHRCHLVDYEHQLPSIILSHCHYSLKVGKGQDVTYDHQALEKHILNRFIHGKPLIILEIPQVVYRKDIYTTGTFGDVRKKVAPQENLPQRVRQDIISELRTPDRLREALDVVEIVLGFLSSGGGKADKPLGEYIDKTLKMRERSFSQKAKMACQLKHTLSLWETIAVELARQLCLRGQEPFDSMRQEFLRELSKNEDDENQFTALDRCLGLFDPDLLLGTLYEFIETYVKCSQQQEHNESLVGTLKMVLDRHGINLPQIAELPASIKLNQAVATWKHIVHYYAKRH